jgi:hypothetical protein
VNTYSCAQQIDQKVKEALEIECFSYLESKGISPISESEKYYYYRSPLTGGKRGSFIVNKNNNRWNDYHGEGRWDRVISLVMELEKVTFLEAVDILLNDSNDLKPFEYSEENISSIRIVSKKNNFSYYLYSYAQHRKLDIYLLKEYCKQITVVFPHSLKPKLKHEFIGFKNNLGGWELSGWKGKRSVSPKYFTVIGDKGDKYFFEGFINFLSFLILNKINRIDGTAVILNSLSLITWIYHIFKMPGKNFIYFDNDKTADDKIDLLKQEQIPFIDMRNNYKIFNDLNDQLTEKVLS